jgi:hypothetical protein
LPLHIVKIGEEYCRDLDVQVDVQTRNQIKRPTFSMFGRHVAREPSPGSGSDCMW